MIDKNIIIEAKQLVETASNNKDLDYFCKTRDVLKARIESFVLRTNKYLESAIIGEIGNNTFDHNWDFDSKHLRGAYFNPEFKKDYVILADYGTGIQSTLKKVSNVNSDTEALNLGFTQQVSGRAPERRGNGLSFVYETIKSKKWSLYFQSGNACCIIENGIAKIEETEDNCIGCFAIMKFQEETNNDCSSK